MGRFLAAARLWATDIIVADQGSTDGTLEILRSAPDVTTVLNESSTFDEAYRQRLLLEKARQVPGNRILFGLDADEALSANCTQTGDWERIQKAEPGTVLAFPWVNVLPGFDQAWIPPNLNACGFVDDGAKHEGRAIHSPRVPRPEGAPVLEVHDFVILHFQYAAWERMRSKHRWYQTWECLHNLQGRPLDIFRQYHHMHGSWDKSEVRPLRPEWLAGFDHAGIDFRSLKSEPVTWWDAEVARLLAEHGTRRFSKLAIWDKDWNAVARQAGMNRADLSDPRSVQEKAIHALLAVTQGHRANWPVRCLEKGLRSFGW